jgi:hypothetical protein
MNTDHYKTLSQIAKHHRLSEEEIMKILRGLNYVDGCSPSIKSGIYSEIRINERGRYYSVWDEEFVMKLVNNKK